MLRFLFAVCLLCAFSAGAQQAFTNLKTEKEFHFLAGKPLNTNLGTVESIKVVYDLEKETIYFINSKRYRFHYEFCFGYLMDQTSLERFNRINYGASGERDYLLGNINYDAPSDLYFIDLSVFDKMQESLIIRLYKQIKVSTFFGDKLRFLLNTERLLGLETSLKAAIPVLKPSELYENKTFQRVSPGKCTGRLRFEPDLDSLRDQTPFRPEDILVTKGTPKYVPNVAAIILDEFQTPLSHLSILGVNRKIPIAVDKKLIRDPEFYKLNGQWVTIEVTDTQVGYTLSDPKYRHTNHQKPEQLTADTGCRELVSLVDFQKFGAHALGNKAFNFGLMSKVQEIGRFKAPEAAFAIPFYYYVKHTATPKIRALTAQLTQYEKLSDDSLRNLLKTLRTEIRQLPLDPQFIREIKEHLTGSGFTTFRFRSSTNAEDASGFSGAGLYDSKTVDLSDPDKSIEKAVLKVWASLWSYEAFMERRFFHLSDEHLAMGILVHRSFPQEEANGVLITKNIYRESYGGMTINVQVGDVPVVNPPQGVSCDQLVIVHELEESGFNRTVEYIRNSSLTMGKTVLSAEEVKRLEFAVEAISEYFWKNGMRNKKLFVFDLVLDIEFKFQGENRDLYIKQVRFFNE